MSADDHVAGGPEAVAQVLREAEAVAPDPELEAGRADADGQGRGGAEGPDDADPPPAAGDDGYGDLEGGEGHPLAPDGSKLARNDTGNGRRFALYYGEDAIFVPRVGWHLWNGRAWSYDRDMILARRKGQFVQDRIADEIPHLRLTEVEERLMARREQAARAADAIERTPRDERGADAEGELHELRAQLDRIGALAKRRGAMRAAHRKFAVATGNKAKIEALLHEAQVDLSRDLGDLDADPLTINAEGGVLRFAREPDAERPGRFYAAHAHEAHDRALLLTKCMAVAYDPEAACPRFHAFLERVQPSREIRGFLQRWFGLSMTGLVGEQKFAFLYGRGANGKSVLVDLMARMMGDYAATAKIETLTGKNRRGGGDATPDLIPLMGARSVRASEPEEGERLQEGMIKEMTGGEPMLVRALHSDFIEVRPIFKLTISGNHKPDIRGTDDGIWRRVLLVPFDVQIPVAERDEGLSEVLWSERAGVFNWLIDGLLEYLEEGLKEPPAVLEATRDYRTESDPYGTFLTECCEVTGDERDFVSSRVLIDAFNFARDEAGESRFGQRTVSLKLKALAGGWRHPDTGRAFATGKNEVTGYRGIRFKPGFRSRLDAAPLDRDGRPVARGSGGT